MWKHSYTCAELIHVCALIIFFFHASATLSNLNITRPKPVEHGYVFSIAVGTIWEWLKTGTFFFRGRTVDWGGGGAGSFLK